MFRSFQSVHIIPELNTTDLELIIVQLLDLDAKDAKPCVEWEMPFPHVSSTELLSWNWNWIVWLAWGSNSQPTDREAKLSMTTLYRRPSPWTYLNSATLCDGQDSPIKGKTEEARGLGHFKYDAQFRAPINRKNRSFQRAIKSKAIKLEVVQKGWDQ